MNWLYTNEIVKNPYTILSNSKTVSFNLDKKK